jgi:16S rRNA (cytosine967-C5)-methyltransferase
MTTGLDPRRAAARAFTKVLTRHWTLEAALESTPGHVGMEPRDRAFARAIAATTLRRAGQTTAVLNEFLSKPLEETSRAAQSLLMTGATQILWMDVPPHAVVSATVELAQERDDARRLKGLINAVLRKIATEGAALARKAPPQTNLPDWLRTSWRKAYGPGRLSQITEALLQAPPLDITVKNPDEREKWAEAIGAKILPNGTLRKAQIGDITALPGFDEGAWWAQDAAAAIPAQLLNAQPGEHVVDLCAAPGGKTMQLCSTGARVTAIDISEKRLERVRQNLKRTGFEPRIVATDARGWTPRKPVDAVLLDAPCSATGTLRRHPEAAWIKQDSDVYKLRDLQRTIIRSAVKMLRPGGRLIVCTCSLQLEEGEQLARETAKTQKSLRVDPILSEELSDLDEAITDDGYLRLTPALWKDRGGMDGFFIARFRKVG